MDFRATLIEVTSRLDGAGARWAVIGGVAMGVYGVVRATVDIDLLVDGDSAAALPQLLEPLGYGVVFRWEESSHFKAATRELCPLDVLHAHRPHSIGMLSRARRITLGDGGPEVPVVELEDLIGLKVQAAVNDPERRRGELVDIRALLEAAAGRGGGVDRVRVREYFALFGEEAEMDALAAGVDDAFA